MHGKETHTIPDKPIRRRHEKKVAENEFVRVFMDDIEFADGYRGTHLRVIEPNSGVVVLVMDENHRVYLQWAYRYAIDDYCLEIIRGYGESGEDVSQAVLRELREEAGFRAETVETPEHLGTVHPNSSILTNRIPVFLVRVSSPESADPIDAREGLEAAGWYTLEELWALMASGRIHDAFTLSAVALLYARQHQACQEAGMSFSSPPLDKGGETP